MDALFILNKVPLARKKFHSQVELGGCDGAPIMASVASPRPLTGSAQVPTQTTQSASKNKNVPFSARHIGNMMIRTSQGAQGFTRFEGLEPERTVSICLPAAVTHATTSLSVIVVRG
jgi:hypothetical protein